MCGIVGIISKKPARNKEFFRHELRKMTHAIASRGNNGENFFEDGGCFLGHRRLSIIDLSNAASQPMTSAGGRYTIVFNGEIYNYLELAAELARHGIKPGSKSDTEILLLCYIMWGKGCLNKLRGMFSFAVWDSLNETLFAVRDHLGIKPFYWFHGEDLTGGKAFVFASEIKAFLSTVFVPRKINKRAFHQYLSFYSISPPDTIIKDIYALMPGHYLEYNGSELKISRYWNISDVRTDKTINVSSMKERVRSVLEEAVKLRMRADVSVGAFLSGGLDSATIVGLMSSLSDKPVETFSIGFEKEGDYLNELSLANKVAKKFGCNHHEVIINGSTLRSQFKKFIASIDQPSGDGINSFLVSEVASRHVTVALSGLGGDEIFLGYRYFQDLARMLKFQDNKLLKQLIPVLAMLYKHSRYFRSFAWKTKFNFLKHFPAEKEEFYLLNRTLFSKEDIWTLASEDEELFVREGLKNIFCKEPDVLNAFSKAELSWYTQSMLLRDVDAVSMAHTLEVRVPFLDKCLVELLLTIPSDYKVNLDQVVNKPLLAETFGDILPEELLMVPKKGFEMPIGFWLSEYFESELKELCDTSWLNDDYVSELVHSLYKNPRDYLKVWSLLVLKEWLKYYEIEGFYEKEDSLYTPWSGTRGSSSEPSIFD